MNSNPDSFPRRAIRSLTLLEARVLGVLLEKQHTVPDTYPLSLNALTSGCNQKTARAPVMNVTEAEVLTAIDGLKHLSLVLEGSSSRVPRFEHNMNRVLGIPSQATGSMGARVDRLVEISELPVLLRLYQFLINLSARLARFGLVIRRRPLAGLGHG